jgi:hypothetical protein
MKKILESIKAWVTNPHIKAILIMAATIMVLIGILLIIMVV